MSIKQKVLQMLEDNRGNDVSGSEIAQHLGVSRSAVWKAVNQLKAEGHNITAGTNRGYCLAQTSTAVSVPGIERYLKTPCKIEIFKSVTSTNDVLKQMASSGADEWTVVVAGEQTAGRGRMGRQFYSPKGTGIYMSILLRPKFPAQQALLITTAAAVAVANALEENGCQDVKIKWVNDVFSQGKKVCGILTEGAFDFETGLLDYAILGIGINVDIPSGGFPDNITSVAGAAFSGVDVVRSRIIAQVIDNFSGFYNNLIEKPHLAQYRSRSLLTGKTVLVPNQDETQQAIVLDIDDEFRLVVRYSDGRQEALSSGEVSVKLKK